MDISDRIERVMVLKAPQERVWKAISTPEELARWFPDKIEGDFRVGGEVIFKFGESFRTPGTIVAIDPQSYFAYRWGSKPDGAAPGDDSKWMTLVEFRLQAISEGTQLTMVESGFSSLPLESRAQTFQEHSEGWDEELGQLGEYLKTRH